MKKKNIALLTVMAVPAVIAVYLAVMQVTESDALPQASDFEVLAGRWDRIDGSYSLQVQDVMSDGKVSVGYFNPGAVHVAESRVTRQEGRIRLFVRLRDKDYPDCTYTLFYYPEQDVLAGAYYQAAVDRTYEVVFVRKEAG
jgi:hypothetical protein